MPFRKERREVDLHWFATQPTSLSTFIKRYFSYPSGYKDYCKKGKDFRPPLPGGCPFCRGDTSCLNGHGWYERKPLLDTCEPFYIYRYLCKKSGKTVSMHPDFLHAYKRYLLETVIFCIAECILTEKTTQRISVEQRVSLRSLQRWKRGFNSGLPLKRLCLPPPDPLVSPQNYLPCFFKPNDIDNSIDTMVQLMITMEHSHQSSLY